jgi:hypothetical protein
MTGQVSLFGIRHHGPGSARRLVQALDELRPAAVLIEGDLLPMLADPDVTTPVALLIYAEENPANASFFPFGEYSPEYQAVRWAVRHGAALRFIDLPASDRLGLGSGGIEDEAATSSHDDPVSRDPIGALATAAGYDDGESWWSDVIEENPASGPVFAAVTNAMTVLRAASKPLSSHEAAREAHMRIEIAKSAKQYEGAAIAVVCGAWHVPALLERRSTTAERELLKGRPKTKIKATWAPWTAPRLARASGYGAGVVAPGWCAHLWETREGADRGAVWLAKLARLLRDRGQFVSTASVIEAQRLGTALAALRDRPAPGFEELREAAIACLCGGERAIWDDIATELLIGSTVGSIPAGTQLAPASHGGSRAADRLPAPAAAHRRSGRGDPVRRPVGIDGHFRRLRFDLRGGDGVAAGGRDQARVFRHRYRRPDRGALRPCRGAVRRAAWRAALTSTARPPIVKSGSSDRPRRT